MHTRAFAQCLRYFRQRFPDYKDVEELFFDMATRDLPDRSIVVDLGCGSRSVLAKYGEVPAAIGELIGIDIASEALNSNQDVDAESSRIST